MRLLGSALALFVFGACGDAAPPAEPAAAVTDYPTVGSIERVDPRLDALLDADAPIEQVASGFSWSEGPVWVPARNALLFNDIPQNTLWQWSEEGGLEVFLRPAGFASGEPHGRELGVNGLFLDADGDLLMASHGDRAIMRLDESNYTKTAVADRYDGRRFNSPNDLVVHSSGSIYFTDPPYGLEGLNDSPDKELPFNGVYRWDPDGGVTLVVDSLRFPNGVILSPDEQTLYVAQSDGQAPIYAAYDVQEDLGLANGRILFDAMPLREEGRRGAPDGMAVDVDGNLWATGPGGVHVLTPEGERLGTIETGQATANATFGGPDGSTLYMTADSLLLRVQTNTRGYGF